MRTRRPQQLAHVAVVILLCLSTGTAACAAGHSSAGSDELFNRLDTDSNGVIAEPEIASEHRSLFERLLRRADINRDRVLSRDEFLASLVPSRPEKPLETKQSDEFPQADAVRYLLLTMDVNRNSWIERDEVPEEMIPVFELLADQVDTNQNDTLDRYELSRNPRQLIPVAARYVARERIDVQKELKKLEKTQGSSISRFDKTPGSFFELINSPKQAKLVFSQFDANDDGLLVSDELPDPIRQQLSRFLRMADRDRDGGLSEREFLNAVERLGVMMKARQSSRGVEAEASAERRAKQSVNKTEDAMAADDQ